MHAGIFFHIYKYLVFFCFVCWPVLFVFAPQKGLIFTFKWLYEFKIADNELDITLAHYDTDSASIFNFIRWLTKYSHGKFTGVIFCPSSPSVNIQSKLCKHLPSSISEVLRKCIWKMGWEGCCLDPLSSNLPDSLKYFPRFLLFHFGRAPSKSQTMCLLPSSPKIIVSAPSSLITNDPSPKLSKTY